MTAAFGDLTGPILRSSVRGRSARIFTVLVVVLPVPMLGVLGLSLPLPATVERIAAKLVPFGDSGAFDASGTHALAQGSIVLAPGDQGFIQADSTRPTGSGVSRLSIVAASHGSSRHATPSAPTGTQPHDQTSDVTSPTAATAASERGTTPSAPQAGGDNSSPGPSGGGVPTPSAGGTQTTPAPSPIDTVTAPANDVVGSVTNTVTDATGDATNAATDAVGSATSGATDTVGGILPP
jgi:hypothetical protein